MGNILFIIALLFPFVIIEIVVISCCIMAGSDPLSRYLSDLEQIQYIKQWNKRKKGRFT